MPSLVGSASTKPATTAAVTGGGIYSNSYYGYSNIWWQANASGWTALHYAASQFIPLEWWEWILIAQQQQQEKDLTAASLPFAQPNVHTNDYEKKQDSIAMNLDTGCESNNRFFTQVNEVGQSIFDIWACTAVQPLPWQSTPVQNAARQLQHAIHTVLQQQPCSSSSSNNKYWPWIRQQMILMTAPRKNKGVYADCSTNTTSITNTSTATIFGGRTSWKNEESNMTTTAMTTKMPPPLNHHDKVVIARCIRMLRQLELLCNAAGYEGSNVMETLGQAGGVCPSLELAHFLWSYYEYYSSDSVLSLHQRAIQAWVSSFSNATEFHTTYPWQAPVPNYWLQALLSRNSSSSSPHCHISSLSNVVMASGRTVWQEAVANGQPWSILQELIKHDADCCSSGSRSNQNDQYHHDPVTGLPMAALRATTTSSGTTTFLHNKKNSTKDASLEETHRRRARLQAAGGPRGLASVLRLWPAEKQAAAVQKASIEWNAEELSVIYTLLRRQPQQVGVGIVEERGGHNPT